MPLPRQWKKQVAGLTVLGLVLVCLAGSLFFILALRPCRLRLEPGTLVAYAITGERQPVDAEGEPIGSQATWEQELHLLCLSDANEAALVEPGSRGRGDEVTLLSFAENGAVRRLDPALRLLPDGKAIGPFDFNLLPLPEGLEQTWRVPIVYAVPPPGKRQVEARVSRVASGIRPEFELELPTIEWVDDRAGERYVQIRHLRCRYRFDTTTNIVDHARLSFILGIEEEDGPRFQRYRVEMAGSIAATAEGDEPIALRDLALATSRLQRARDQGVRLDRQQDLAQRIDELLRRTDPGSPLARVARQVAEQIGQQAAAGGGWYVQVATVSRSRRPQAEELVAELQADEYPAAVVEQGASLVIRVGPYGSRSDEIIAVFRDRFPLAQPLWVRR